MLTFARIVLRLIEDALRWVMLLARSDESVRAENLVLRRQLAMFLERGIRPHRMDAATRASLAVLTRLFDWRTTLVVGWSCRRLRSFARIAQAGDSSGE